ncbi:hypothetical protein PILCRDRAFT_274623 [Piloderma croceum F 1598]|uniref:HMG box domain-containing protein n=1 Tax=Piloderma croceum (strain F 1598) TaxID=765440 RepID=A0A0C3G9T0_PILCF|nr:hypothetical protein PILCRDRAFT_274623 [Piloderma croceum F 1598]
MNHPSSNSGDSLVHRREKKTYPRKRDGPRRPANSFILFRKHFMEEYHGPYLSAGDMSKRASEAWHGLCDAQHAVWKAKADEEKADHAKKHPDYRYRPKKRHRSPKKDDACSKLLEGRDNKIGSEGHRSTLSASSMPPTNKAEQHVSQSEQTDNISSSATSSMVRRPHSRRMFTANDALWTPELAPVNISSRPGLAYSMSPSSSDRNSSSPSGNQTSFPMQSDTSQWFEYDILDRQPVPELSNSPSTNASSLLDSDASDPVSAPPRT